VRVCEEAWAFIGVEERTHAHASSNAYACDIADAYADADADAHYIPAHHTHAHAHTYTHIRLHTMHPLVHAQTHAGACACKEAQSAPLSALAKMRAVDTEGRMA
jgi:hypothetical protein